MVLHRHHHRAHHSVGYIGRSGDEQKIASGILALGLVSSLRTHHVRIIVGSRLLIRIVTNFEQS
jgi:hypothetical protein